MRVGYKQVIHTLPEEIGYVEVCVVSSSPGVPWQFVINVTTTNPKSSEFLCSVLSETSSYVIVMFQQIQLHLIKVYRPSISSAVLLKPSATIYQLILIWMTIVNNRVAATIHSCLS